MPSVLLAQDTFFGHGNDNSPIAGDNLFDTPALQWDAASGALRGNGAFNGGGGRSWIDQALVSNDFEYWFEATGSDDAADYSAWIILWMTAAGSEVNSIYLKVDRLTAPNTRTTTLQSQAGGLLQTLESGVSWPDATLVRFGVTVTDAGIQCWTEPGGGGTRTLLGTPETPSPDFRADASRAYHGMNGASGVNSRIRALAFTQLDTTPPKGGGSVGRDPVPASGRVLSSTRIQLPVPPASYSWADQSQLRSQIMRYLTQLATAAVDTVALTGSIAWTAITGKPSVFPPDYVTYPPDWDDLTDVPSTFPSDPIALDDLTDVSTAGAGSGDVLTYNGASWDPQPSGGGGSLPATTDLGDMLASDGSNFDVLPVGADGEVLTADSGAPLGVSWQASGGGGGGGAYGPDVPPGSPGTYDDEFTSGPGGSGAPYTVTTNVTAPNVVTWGRYGTFLELNCPGGAAGDVYQFWRSYAMAVGDSLTVKLMGSGDNTSCEVDVFINSGASGGFSGTTGVDIQYKGGGTQPTLTLFTVNGGGFSTVSSKSDAMTGGPCYVTVKRTATNTYTCWYSGDGVSWRFLGTSTPTFTAASIQFAIQCNGAGNPNVLAIDWIRSNWAPL